MHARTRTTAAAGIALLVAGLVAGAAVAATFAARTTASGGSITKVNVVRSSDILNTSSTSYTNIPGASTSITIPAGEHAILVARFTTQEDCTVGDGNPDGSCLARIMVDGAEAQPSSGGTIIDTVSGGSAPGVRSAALDRSTAPLGAGTHTVQVQVKVTSGLMILEVTDWHLTVERVRA
jgi:hypothetical protein